MGQAARKWHHRRCSQLMKCPASSSLLAINNTVPPASGGPENPLREKRQEGPALRPRVLAQAVVTRRCRSTTRRCWCTACTAGAK